MTISPTLTFVDETLCVDKLIDVSDWIQDGHRDNCHVCARKFSPFRRKHHCRTCGEVICSTCSQKHQLRLSHMGYPVALRVCLACVLQATACSVAASDSSPESSDVFENTTLRTYSASLTDVHDSNMDGTMSMLVNILAQAFNAPIAAIALTHFPHMMSFRATYGCTSSDFPDSLDVVEQTKMANTIVCINHIPLADKIQVLDTPISFYAGAPLMVSGNVVGVVFVMDFNTTRASMNMRQHKRLECIAKIITKNLDNVVLPSTLPRSQSTTDMNAFSEDDCDSSVTDIDVLTSPTPEEDCDSSVTDDLLTSPTPSEALTTPSPTSLAPVLHCPEFKKQNLPTDHEEIITRNIYLLETFATKSNLWNWYTNVDDIDLSVASSFDVSYVKATVMLEAPMNSIAAKIVDIRNTEIYSEFISNFSKECVFLEASVQVSVQMGSGFHQSLLHTQEHHDGSIMIVLLRLNKIEVPENSYELLMGWHLKPQESGSTRVVCYTPCLSTTKVPLEFNAVCKLIQRLERDLGNNTEMAAKDIVMPKMLAEVPSPSASTSSFSSARTSSPRPSLPRFSVRRRNSADPLSLQSLLVETTATQQLMAEQEVRMVTTIDQQSTAITELTTMLLEMKVAMTSMQSMLTANLKTPEHSEKECQTNILSNMNASCQSNLITRSEASMQTDVEALVQVLPPIEVLKESQLFYSPRHPEEKDPSPKNDFYEETSFASIGGSFAIMESRDDTSFTSSEDDQEILKRMSVNAEESDLTANIDTWMEAYDDSTLTPTTTQGLQVTSEMKFLYGSSSSGQKDVKEAQDDTELVESSEALNDVLVEKEQAILQKLTSEKALSELLDTILDDAVNCFIEENRQRLPPTKKGVRNFFRNMKTKANALFEDDDEEDIYA